MGPEFNVANLKRHMYQIENDHFSIAEQKVLVYVLYQKTWYHFWEPLDFFAVTCDKYVCRSNYRVLEQLIKYESIPTTQKISLVLSIFTKNLID